MSSFASLGTVLLGGLLVASFQLPLGTLLLLYHSSLGKNVRKRTRSLASAYISGACLLNFLLLGTLCFLVSSLSFAGTLSTTALSVVFGILLALAVLSWAVYYKRGTTTELWIPRTLSNFLTRRAKTASETSESFSLGMLASLSEIIFSFSVYLLVADAILRLSPTYQALSLVGFTVLSVLPLLALRIVLRSGRNIAEVQRWRLKNKSFFRIFLGLAFLVLAFFLLAFTILGGRS
ncbi:sulfite exporter TauE/SafE family protein [Candidatus Saccharibacteria bacterium]|nr:sulfite exporter TauE/SafE family protein [Candidatus Saccharibacteria bacterium]